MKTIVLILCVAIAGTWALENPHLEALKQARAKCQSVAATHVDDEIWKKVNKNEKVEFPSNWGAHMLCLSKGTGLQNADGSINQAEIRSRLVAVTSDETLINKTVQECGTAQATPELSARHVFKCLHEFFGAHKH